MKILIKSPVGVTTKKNIMPIMIGAIKFPNNMPNLNHALFKGVRNLEFKSPRIKKINDMVIDQILIAWSFKIGHKPIVKKTIKKTTPKLLFDPIFISL